MSRELRETPEVRPRTWYSLANPTESVAHLPTLHRSAGAGHRSGVADGYRTDPVVRPGRSLTFDERWNELFRRSERLEGVSVSLRVRAQG